MEIKRFIMGELESNSYLVVNDKEAVLFDVGSDDVEVIKKYLLDNAINLKALLLTHGHIDHIKGARALADEYPDMDIYIGEEDKEFLETSSLNLSKFVYYKDIEFKLGERVKTLRENDEVFGFEVLSTPGHTIGGKVFYNKDKKWLITGDTLFAGSMGRTDFPTGDFQTLMKSLNKIFDKYPVETKVFPGHGEQTDLLREKRNFIY